MVIQAWFSTPPSWPTIVGMAVETMVWSRLESSMPAMSAAKMIQMRRWVRISCPSALDPRRLGRAADGAVFSVVIRWAPG
ncbi:hypothetical protein GCM10025867_00270 [Frondihabitans sucicola]|uniref:Uncharacterized protein n=1 Tax=Frondihabitans sucicola TaxID=1268041 RepID=A0ABN6XS10_9MICO|nr:hypothetical protein [Frondihabitans sucicola]BDZ47786.1 hypothetical protein GCM10025867_00270 [Frondihabitans sucicola]